MDDYNDLTYLSKGQMVALYRRYHIPLPKKVSRMGFVRDMARFKAHTIVYTHKLPSERVLLTKMPPDIIKRVLGMLAPCDRNAFGTTSKTMYRIYRQVFPKTPTSVQPQPPQRHPVDVLHYSVKKWTRFKLFLQSHHGALPKAYIAFYEDYKRLQKQEQCTQLTLWCFYNQFNRLNTGYNLQLDDHAWRTVEKQKQAETLALPAFEPILETVKTALLKYVAKFQEHVKTRNPTPPPVVGFAKYMNHQNPYAALNNVEAETLDENQK